MQPNNVYPRLLANQKRINLLRGGTRSGKTTSMVQMAVRWLKTGSMGLTKIPKGTFYIIRQTFPALRMTVLKEFIECCIDIGFYNHLQHLRSTHLFSYKGRYVQFLSADQSEKFKGISPDLAWLNEADSIDRDTFDQLRFRLVHHMYLDYNPSNPDSYIKTVLEDKWIHERDDMFLDVSTYHDNRFLPDSIVKEIELLETLDPELYKVYNRGEWMKVKGLIYPIWDDNFDPPEDCKTVYGLDFGFNDPMALLKVEYDKNNLWLSEVVYERELTTGDLIERIKHIFRERIICDSANPNAIEELKRAGFRRAKGARKGGKDYIKKGIDAVKQYHIHVNPTSINLISEFRKYKYQVDDDGKAIDKPSDNFNHCMDAMRYAVDYLHRGKGNFRVMNLNE